MRRSWPLALISLLLIAGVGFWGYSQYVARRQMENYLSSQYQQSFYQMINAVEGAQATAAKGLVSSSPRENIVTLAELWRQADIAKSNLNNLPISHPVLSRTSQFLNQLSDYAYSLAKQNADGRPTTDEQWEKLAKLRQEAGYLSRELLKAQDETAANIALGWTNMLRNTRQQLKKADQGIDTHFNRIDKQMIQYPTLIYDGPFSDHVVNATPKGLSGDNIDEGEAQGVARRFVDFKDGVVETGGKIDGRIPAYRVMVRPQGAGRNMTQMAEILVSRRGGHVVTMLMPRAVSKVNIDLERAVEIARDFLDQRGFTNFLASHKLEQEGSAVIVFVAQEDGVIIYPDQVKVKVALDNGEVIGFDASQYYMAHQKRELAQPKLSADQAERLVNPRLQIEKTSLALIPLPTLKEVLCWEVKGTLDGETYLIYLNAENGREEQILQLVEAKEGTLVI